MTPSFTKNKLLDGVSADVLSDLQIQPLQFETGDVIFSEGEPAECLFLIDTGTVRISKIGRGGRQETLAYFEPSDFFGEMGLYGRTTRSARATAVGPVTLGCLDRPTFEVLLTSAPEALVANLLKESVSRLRDTDTHFIEEMLEAERMSLVGSMLSTIIHDIRGPLSVIRGAADLLSMEIPVEKRERYTQLLRRSVERITDMTQELLDYARGTTRLNLEPVSPHSLIAELDEEVLRQLATAGIEVEYAISFEGEVALDRSRFFRVLHNIVKNAAEAMPRGGKLTIGVRRDAGRVVFEITDTGVGIPPELLPKIFEPFVTHGKSGGTGLGMAIVHSVVEAHRGTISAESAQGEGTRFTIMVPVASEGAPPAAPPI